MVALSSYLIFIVCKIVAFTDDLINERSFGFGNIKMQRSDTVATAYGCKCLLIITGFTVGLSVPNVRRAFANSAIFCSFCLALLSYAEMQSDDAVAASFVCEFGGVSATHSVCLAIPRVSVCSVYRFFRVRAGVSEYKAIYSLYSCRSKHGVIICTGSIIHLATERVTILMAQRIFGYINRERDNIKIQSVVLRATVACFHVFLIHSAPIELLAEEIVSRAVGDGLVEFITTGLQSRYCQVHDISLALVKVAIFEGIINVRYVGVIIN